MDFESLLEATRSSGESKDAANHFGATLGAACQDREHLLSLLFRRLLGKHLGGHEDRREDVVEIMRDAARQGADAFHSLDTQKLIFELFLRCDVGADGEDGFGIARRITN